jgi:hypothetical protein
MRPRGRPRLCWEDKVEEDVTRLECRNWKVALKLHLPFKLPVSDI